MANENQIGNLKLKFIWYLRFENLSFQPLRETK